MTRINKIPKGRLGQIQIEIGSLLWQEESTEETKQRLIELWKEERKLLEKERPENYSERSGRK